MDQTEIDATARALAAWDGRDLADVERSIEAMERFAGEALGPQTPRERVERWGEITATAASALAKLMDLHRQGNGQARDLGARLQRATALLVRP
jgi:hypothetical protein